MDNNDNMINTSITTTSKSFVCKTKIIWNTSNSNSGLNAVVVVLLKYLSNFWRSLDLSLINCKIELDLILLIYMFQLLLWLLMIISNFMKI